jgi:hypothetical protein
MNVRTVLEDAQVLLKQGRFEGALLQVLVAIAGTSKKRYPPAGPKDRNDREAFTKFIRDEMSAIAPCSSITAEIDGEMTPIEDILYKILRCKVMHEAEMPEQLVFEENDKWSIRPDSGGLVLSKNWVIGLMRAVVLARENNHLFKDIASAWKAPWWPGGSGPTTVAGTLNIRIVQKRKPNRGRS